MKKKCPKCESNDIHITEYPYPTDSMATCYVCGYADLSDRFPEQNVFDQITTSPEVLAERLVMSVWDEGALRWESTIIPIDKFSSRTEAIVAIVAKLKEVV